MPSKYCDLEVRVPTSRLVSDHAYVYRHKVQTFVCRWKIPYLCKPLPVHHVTAFTISEEDTPRARTTSRTLAFGAWNEAMLPANK